jgi:hypothetical protein
MRANEKFVRGLDVLAKRNPTEKERNMMQARALKLTRTRSGKKS